MNITLEEYRARLYAALAGFDPNEVAQAVNYYIELIEDADDPAEQMAKLGTPEQLAQRIIADNGWTPPQNFGGYYGGQPMGGMTAEDLRRSSTSGLAKRVLALILTFPFWLTAFILIITLLIVIWSVFIALPAGTVAAIIESMRWIGKYFGYALAVLFAGVGLAGLTILLFAPVRAATGGIFKAIAGFARFLFGIKKKDEGFDLKKTKNYFSKAVLATGALLFVLGGGISAPLYAKAANSPEKFAQALGLDTYEYEYSDSIDSIKIDIESVADLEILPSSNGKMYLKAENVNVHKIAVLDQAEAGFTYVNPNAGSVHFFNLGNLGNPYGTFKLYLPEKEYKSADIRSSVGDIKVENLTAKQIVIGNSAGDTKLTNVKQTGSDGSFSVTSDLGDIKLNNCTIESGSAELIQHCGDVKFETGSANSLRIENDLGSIKGENLTAANLDLKNNCGDIKLSNSSATGSITCKVELGDCKLELNGTDYNVSAHTDLGDAKINGSNAYEVVTGGKIPVNVTGNTGDVKVDFN